MKKSLPIMVLSLLLLGCDDEESPNNSADSTDFSIACTSPDEANSVTVAYQSLGNKLVDWDVAMDGYCLRGQLTVNPADYMNFEGNIAFGEYSAESHHKIELNLPAGRYLMSGGGDPVFGYGVQFFDGEELITDTGTHISAFATTDYIVQFVINQPKRLQLSVATPFTRDAPWHTTCENAEQCLQTGTPAVDAGLTVASGDYEISLVREALVDHALSHRWVQEISWQDDEDCPMPPIASREFDWVAHNGVLHVREVADSRQWLEADSTKAQAWANVHTDTGVAAAIAEAAVTTMVPSATAIPVENVFTRMLHSYAENSVSLADGMTFSNMGLITHSEVSGSTKYEATYEFTNIYVDASCSVSVTSVFR